MPTLDKHPLATGHTLAIPKQRVGSIYDLDEGGRAEVWDAVRRVRSILAAHCHSDGPAAGQIVSHTRVHVIPRYPGDVPDPPRRNPLDFAREGEGREEPFNFGLYFRIVRWPWPRLCGGGALFSMVTRKIWLSFGMIARIMRRFFGPPARPCRASMMSLGRLSTSCQPSLRFGMYSVTDSSNESAAP